jgi:hypothetical protein
VGPDRLQSRTSLSEELFASSLVVRLSVLRHDEAVHVAEGGRGVRVNTQMTLIYFLVITEVALTTLGDWGDASSGPVATLTPSQNSDERKPISFLPPNLWRV